MIFNAQLKLGNKEFALISCRYSLQRDVDAKGRPSSGINGGIIYLSMESTEDTFIIETMINQYKELNGSIIFTKGVEIFKMKELFFENGYIVEFTEKFNSAEGTSMNIDLVISAQKIKIGNADYAHDWPA